MTHRAHPGIVKRLKRADGHLHQIIAMIEDDRPCLELTQQLQAVENAIDNAKKALIHDHIARCLDRSMKTPRSKRKAAAYNKISLTTAGSPSRRTQTEAIEINKSAERGSMHYVPTSPESAPRCVARPVMTDGSNQMSAKRISASTNGRIRRDRNLLQFISHLWPRPLFRLESLQQDPPYTCDVDALSSQADGRVRYPEMCIRIPAVVGGGYGGDVGAVQVTRDAASS
jgi:uncharacterized protein